MKSEKGYIVKSIMLMLTLLIFLPGIQGIEQEATSQSGVIERMDKGSKSIVVNNAKVLISDNTKIADEKGNILRTNDLKPGISVQIEGVRSPEGFLAQKIIITTPKNKP
jgi:hypothetical protein